MRRSVVEIGEVRKVEVRGLKALYHKTGNPVKEARFLRDVLDRGMSQHDVARELGISQGHISRRLALLERLTPALLRRVEDGEITPGTAYVLSRLSKSAQKAFEDREKVTLKAAEGGGPGERRGRAGPRAHGGCARGSGGRSVPDVQAAAVKYCSRCQQKDDVCDDESCRCRCHPWSRQPRKPPSPAFLKWKREWERQRGQAMHRACVNALKPLSVIVYVARIGNSSKHRRYHTRRDCRAIRANTRLRKLTLESAMARGIPPCRWCGSQRPDHHL